MVKKVLEAVELVETCLDNILTDIETWKNLDEQMKCVEQMPTTSALVRHSPHWKSKLIARLEMEINEFYQCELAEKMRLLENAATTISEYKIQLESTGQPLPSFTLLSDINTVLQCVRENFMEKWFVQNDHPPGRYIPLFRRPGREPRGALRRLKEDVKGLADANKDFA